MYNDVESNESCKRKRKRLTGYLMEVPRLISKFEFPKINMCEMERFNDNEWTNYKCTARSTNGGIVMVWKYLIKS